MKNLMLYIHEGLPLGLESVRRCLRVQVENSLELGWAASDILLYTNFSFTHQGVEAIRLEPGRRPRTARMTSFHKTHCILEALPGIAAGEAVWYHDVDAFQLLPFGPPPADKDLYASLYCARQRLLIQGGSMFFWRHSRRLFEAVYDQLVHHRCRKDEFALTELTRRPEFEGRFAPLDYSYNLGDTDFELRYQLAQKPIKVVHFHPERGEALAKFLAGRNGLGVSPLTDRFARVLGRHGFGSNLAAPPVSRRRAEAGVGLH
jgi:hypothetical protein